MSSALLTAPPQTLRQWLLRSMGWTLLCALPFAGLGYLFNLVAHDGRSTGIAFPLTLLTMGSVLGTNLFFSRAFAGFNILFQQAQWRDWAKSAALSWFTMLVLALFSWLVLNAFMVLVMLNSCCYAAGCWRASVTRASNPPRNSSCSAGSTMAGPGPPHNAFIFLIMVPQFALTFLGIVFCIGDVAALGLLLTWQERAPSPALRWRRLVRGVLPATAVLLGLLLLAFTQVMLLWAQQ